MALFANDSSWPHCQRTQQMAPEKMLKIKSILFFGSSPKFEVGFTWIFNFKGHFERKKSHCRLKVLNIFSVISYQTERSTNLLSLSECFEAGKEVVIHQKQFYYEIWFMLGNINDDVIMCTSAWREHILVNWVIQFYYFKKSISGCTFYSKKFIVLYRGETCVFQGHGQLWIVLP